MSSLVLCFFDIEAHVRLTINALVLSEEKFVATQPSTSFCVFLSRRTLCIVNFEGGLPRN
jgi:hypothetical protein